MEVFKETFLFTIKKSKTLLWKISHMFKSRDNNIMSPCASGSKNESRGHAGKPYVKNNHFSCIFRKWVSVGQTARRVKGAG